MRFLTVKKAALALVVSAISSGLLAADYVDAFEAASAEDYNKAAGIWYELARQDNPDAQFNLALVYHSGVAGNVNEPEALKWYQRAAANGHEQAQEYLVVGYREGWFGLHKNEIKAQYWEDKLHP